MTITLGMTSIAELYGQDEASGLFRGETWTCFEAQNKGAQRNSFVMTCYWVVEGIR